MNKSVIRRMWVMVSMVVGMLALAAPAAWANTFTVTNTNDSGAGSLRQAIVDANSTLGEDTITFAPGVESTSLDGGIGLKSALPQLSDIRIEGPGAHRLKVWPHREAKENFLGQFRIFTVGAGATVSIDGLTISQGGKRSINGGIDGGAILNPDSGTLKITNSTVSDNFVEKGSDGTGAGGGIYNEGTLSVETSTVCNNSSDGGGGGIYNAVGGALTLIDSTVCDNTDPLSGGGILNEGTMTVEASIFSDNHAYSGDLFKGSGGGIFNASGATLTMTNATVSRNHAPQDGSGIHNDGEADLKSNTITENDASISGALFNSGGLTLTNSIVAGNHASDNINGSFADGNFNLIDGNPMLGTLQDNGGPTKTYLPLTGSPAIDGGSSKSASPVDQRGVQRPQDDPSSANASSGDGTDIGAVEVKVPKASIGDVSLTEGTDSTTDATFTVTLSESEVSPRNVSVHYSTQGDEATSPADYSSTSGTLEFTSRGEAISKTIAVAVQGDAMDEPTEGFFVNLSGGMHPEYVADESALGTIRDDDGPPALSISDATATEATSGTANAAFTVSLSAPSGKAVGVSYSTSDGTATVASGDYSSSSGTLYFSPGTASKSISVPVNSDAIGEPDENFFLSLSGPENATVADDKGEGTIVDSPPSTNGAPTASNDSYLAAQDKPLRVAAPGLLSNDSDPEGDALTAAELSDPDHGEVFVKANGSFAYFPDEGYLGADSFTYKASDGSASSDPATVRITVRDVMAPTVSATSPANGATGVAPGARVTATFSEAMKAGSIGSDTFNLYASGSTTPIAATVSYDAATKRAILDPSTNLRLGATYKAVVTTGAKDLAGNALDQDPSVTGNQEKRWSFTIKP